MTKRLSFYKTKFYVFFAAVLIVAVSGACAYAEDEPETISVPEDAPKTLTLEIDRDSVEYVRVGVHGVPGENCSSGSADLYSSEQKELLDALFNMIEGDYGVQGVVEEPQASGAAFPYGVTLGVYDAERQLIRKIHFMDGLLFVEYSDHWLSDPEVGLTTYCTYRHKSNTLNFEEFENYVREIYESSEK